MSKEELTHYARSRVGLIGALEHIVSLAAINGFHCFDYSGAFVSNRI